jgi:hypothetical protein
VAAKPCGVRDLAPLAPASPVPASTVTPFFDALMYALRSRMIDAAFGKVCSGAAKLCEMTVPR